MQDGMKASDAARHLAQTQWPIQDGTLYALLHQPRTTSD